LYNAYSQDKNGQRIARQVFLANVLETSFVTFATASRDKINNCVAETHQSATALCIEMSLICH